MVKPVMIGFWAGPGSRIFGPKGRIGHGAARYHSERPHGVGEKGPALLSVLVTFHFLSTHKSATWLQRKSTEQATPRSPRPILRPSDRRSHLVASFDTVSRPCQREYPPYTCTLLQHRVPSTGCLRTFNCTRGVQIAPHSLSSLSSMPPTALSGECEDSSANRPLCFRALRVVLMSFDEP